MAGKNVSGPNQRFSATHPQTRSSFHTSGLSKSFPFFWVALCGSELQKCTALTHSGSPCLPSAPCLWSEQAESKLQLSEAVPRSLCRETLSPSLLQTLQGLDFSVLATWSLSSFFSAPGVCLSPHCVASSPQPPTRRQALLLHTGEHHRPPPPPHLQRVPIKYLNLGCAIHGGNTGILWMQFTWF